jgi:hypothetical protein
VNAINPWLFRKLPHDPIKDFAPITQRVRIPNVPVMSAETARRLKIATLKDFIACAKAHPARLSYASGGNGSGGHLGRQHPGGPGDPAGGDHAAALCARLHCVRLQRVCRHDLSGPGTKPGALR